jgi:hypothetical protein
MEEKPNYLACGLTFAGLALCLLIGFAIHFTTPRLTREQIIDHAATLPPGEREHFLRTVFPFGH